MVTTSPDSLGVAQVVQVPWPTDTSHTRPQPTLPAPGCRSGAPAGTAVERTAEGRGEGARDTADLREAETLQVASQLAERLNRSLRFYVDQDTGRLAVKVVDRRNGEVLRYIPPEEVLRAAARLEEAISIFFGDEVGVDAGPQTPAPDGELSY